MNGIITTIKTNLDMTVVKSETGSDLQKIRLLSFLSSAKVDKLYANKPNPTVNNIGKPRTTSPALMTAVLASGDASNMPSLYFSS